MSEEKAYIQMQMIWPQERFSSPPEIRLPAGYKLRTYQVGDEQGWYKLMERAGWPDWNDEKLKPWIARILPESWFMAVDTETSEIAASAMGVHDHTDLHPFGGELGWVCADPAHARKGLGLAVCTAVTRRLISAGYQDIHLYTEHYRLPALKIYFKLGYVPFLYLAEMPDRWQAVCAELDQPFTPERWKTIPPAEPEKTP